ncbi:Cytosolic sulfotransferase 17 [Hibiscus syriacus]|uniref:Sulfotransferase n=1 Tax=Hibiscus syriacus TaxID=106335 RepID=A0A6A2XGI4_HIBSY|nr:Cytosolic sulfotransferase 17 [Hibiscus syriacus]
MLPSFFGSKDRSLSKRIDPFDQRINPLEKESTLWTTVSQENPNKILFLKYEDLTEDICCQLKHLAMFFGVSFTNDEEKQGVEEVLKICSFDKLKGLEVNKNGSHISVAPHKAYFRKGKVGDWSNYLTPSMVERMVKLIQKKLDGSGLTFKLSSKSS